VAIRTPFIHTLIYPSYTHSYTTHRHTHTPPHTGRYIQCLFNYLKTINKPIEAEIDLGMVCITHCIPIPYMYHACYMHYIHPSYTPIRVIEDLTTPYHTIHAIYAIYTRHTITQYNTL
jgi:hypothetical protein